MCKGNKRWGRSPGFKQSQAVRDKISVGVKLAYDLKHPGKKREEAKVVVDG
jgi:hypothetical protein